jgi:hypothetical protein
MVPVHYGTDTDTLSFLSELTKTVFKQQKRQFFPDKSVLPIPLQFHLLVVLFRTQIDAYRVCLLFAYVKKIYNYKGLLPQIKSKAAD